MRGAQASPGYQRPSGPKTASRKRRRHESTHPIFAIVEKIPSVAGKVFVPAVATQGHRHVLTGYLRDIIGRNGAGVGERLVIMPYQLVHDFQRLGLNDVFMMVGMKLT